MPYESRLELDRLWLADFDPLVTWIAAQPMWLTGGDGDAVRRHAPDLLLTGADGRVLLVDVKPLRFVQEPDVAAVFSWTGRVCAARGWAYEVWSGGDAVTLSNIRFLAVARRRQFLDDKALAATAVNVATGMSLEQIVAAGGVPSASRPSFGRV